tara:strand:- start:18606 stop:18809 length:204 start_codon:yes stop_codon:yes gene_type:complete
VFHDIRRSNNSEKGEVFQHVLRGHEAVGRDVFRDPLGIIDMTPGDVFPQIRRTHDRGDIRMKKEHTG